MKIHIEEELSIVPEYQWLSVVGYSSFVFRVRACQNVKILLAETMGNYNVMITNIFIGTNNENSSIIHRNDEVINHTPNILHCDEFRAFYVTWTESTVNVGTGASIYHNNILSYTNEDIPLTQAIALMSAAHSEVDYEIIKLVGKAITHNYIFYMRAPNFKG